MSRAPLVLSAAAIFCASSAFALVDASGAIATASANSEAVAVQKSEATQQEHEYRLNRHYRGYDEAPSAMSAPSHRV
jgi:hypothetical protein